MKTYAEALTYLYELPSFQYWRTDTPVVLPELTRVHGLLRRLGSPHKAFASVHIAGTKGKGSVSAMVESILRRAGLRTGLYTSPHLHTFRERIQVNGEMISEEEVVDLANWIRPALEARPATTFEAITAVAFEHFRRHEVDVAVLEVGMGGRFDATNVVHPLVSIITSIGFDHTNILGTTLSAIAGEKAGIIKRGVPVVFTPQKCEAAATLRQAARDKRARQVWIGEDWHWERTTQFPQGQRFCIFPPESQPHPWADALSDLSLPLIGRHQLDNATAAVAAAAEVAAAGFGLSDDGVQQGLAKVNWPARLEVLQAHPWFIVDAAHTVESVEAAFATVAETWERPPTTVVFGVSEGKDVAGMVHLMPPSCRLVLSQAPHPRAMGVAQLHRAVGDFAGEIVEVTSPAEAVTMALSEASSDDIVLVLGSIFLAAAAREAWLAIKGLPMPASDPV